MSNLRFRMGMAEAENASLHGKIKTIEAIEMITRSQEKRARNGAMVGFSLGGTATRPRELQEAPGVKEKQEKDKIESKPNKNGKRVEAGKSLKQLQWGGYHLPESVTAVAFPAAAVVMTQAQHGEAIQGILEHLQGVPIEEEMSTLRLRMGMAEAENASLRGKIKTIEAIEIITRSQEKRARNRAMVGFSLGVTTTRPREL
nr:hypothetical protein [Tanacetum cinerariifolium]